MRKIGCKLIRQSRLLTGNLTGTGRWNGGGDTPFEDRRSGRPLSMTPGAEAERLAKIEPSGSDLSCSDQNEQRPRDLISSLGATPLISLRTVKPRCRERNRRWRISHLNKDLSASYLRVQTGSNLFVTGCCPGNALRRVSSGYKIGGSSVYM